MVSYVDKLLHQICEQEQDPYRIKDTRIEFTQNLLLMNIKVSMKLHDCYVLGLKSLHRSDECVIWEVDNRLLVRAVLSAGILRYAGHLQITTFCPTISFGIDVSYIEIKVKFSFEPESGRKFTLYDLRVGDMRGVNVAIAGLGPANWLINLIINKVVFVFTTFAKSSLEEKLRLHLMDIASGLKLPTEKNRQ